MRRVRRFLSGAALGALALAAWAPRAAAGERQTQTTGECKEILDWVCCCTEVECKCIRVVVPPGT